MVQGINAFYKEGRKFAFKARKASLPVSDKDISIVVEDVFNANYDFKEKESLQEAFYVLLDLAIDSYKQGIEDFHQSTLKEVGHVS